MRRLGLLAAVVVVAACGGSGSSLYTKQPTVACLEKQGLAPGGAADDFVASSATGGAFRVKLKDNSVTVSFGETLDDATNLDQAYRRFHARNVGIDDILRTQQNAVMLWKGHPSDTDIATITGCLKS
jgi:hypothetical protein